MSDSRRLWMGIPFAAGLVVMAGLLFLSGLWPRSGSAADRAGVERGRYLVTIAACNDCHTPWVLGPDGPAPDMTRMLSGHPADLVLESPAAAAGPWQWGGTASNTAYHGAWGVSFASNLTPDEDTGIGAWSEEIFVETLRTGRHWGVSRPILPPMPWPAYGQMTDGDLRSIYAYLRTIPPVKNRVPEPLPPAAGTGG